MTLLYDDINGVYVWVDGDKNPVSPHFDYEDDALQWYKANTPAE